MAADGSYLNSPEKSLDSTSSAHGMRSLLLTPSTGKQLTDYWHWIWLAHFADEVKFLFWQVRITSLGHWTMWRASPCKKLPKEGRMGNSFGYDLQGSGSALTSTTVSEEEGKWVACSTTASHFTPHLQQFREVTQILSLDYLTLACSHSLR